MGEFADDLIDAWASDWDFTDDCDDGDDSGFTGGGYVPYYRPRTNIKCRNCGQGGLHWEHAISGWRLYAHGSNKPHKCYKKTAKREAKALPTWIRRETRRFMIQEYTDSFIA